MNFAPFYLHFPEVATEETALITINDQAPKKVPRDQFVLQEYYCFDKSCDCRKVILAVSSRTRPAITLASIGFGWESPEFYIRWMGGMGHIAKDLAGVYLELAGPQTDLSSYFLNIVRNMSKESAFKQAISRHHQSFKIKMRNLKVNNLCPCDSGKKFKKCCKY